MSIPSISPRIVAPPPDEGTRDFSPFATAASSFNSPPVMTITPSDTASQEETISRNPSPAQVDHAVKQVNDAFVQKGQSLYASLEKDKETGIHVVKLLDKNTKEIVSQYPSKEIVAIAASITEYQESKGQLLDVRV